MKSYLLVFVVFVTTLTVTAQVAVNKDGSNPTSGTILDVKSSATVKEHVVVQDATGYLGVGTTSPQSRLDVWGTIRGSIDLSNYVELSAAPILTGPLSGTVEGFLKVSGPATQRYDFIFENAGISDTLFSMIRATGNVGIGTTFPMGKLHVSASTNDVTAGRASIGIETGGFQSWLGMALENATIPGDAEPFIGYGPPTESFRIIQVNPLGPGTEMRMVFHPLGPVGIGDPSTHTIPTAALQVSNRNDVWPIFNLLDNDVNVMTVLDGGNVGIGTVMPTEKLEVNGTVKVNLEVNRPAQGTTDLIPIAYGVVSYNGTILSGSGNFTVSHPGTGDFRITIAGETFTSDDYTANATARDTTAARIVTIGDNAGDLRVRVWTSGGSATDNTFHFIVFKP